MASGILDTYMVLDFTDERGEIGPMLLGDLGADVIKVEPPGGSTARRQPPFLDGAHEDEPPSLQFAAFNRNKRSILLDPRSEADAEFLRKLIAEADFIFESDRLLESGWGLTPNDIEALNSRIVHVRITPFGNDGPHADLPYADLTLAAMGGPVALQGPLDRAPIRISVPQVWRHAGAEAAAGAMLAHANMRRTGRPQFVDLSAQCTMTWTMLNAMDAFAIQGFDFQRTGSSITQSVGDTPLVHPTRDGYLVAIPMGQVLMGCTEAIIADGLVDTSFREIDWAFFQANLATPEQLPISLAECLRICRAFFALHDKHELFELGLNVGSTLAPINTLPELLALDHLKQRDYWHSLAVTDQASIRAPGFWAKPQGFEMEQPRPAPRLNEHGDEIRAAYATPRVREALAADNELPFAGIRVADFAWVGVGPISSKYLADHGADVVRVESEGRPDVLRGGMPFKDNERGWNRSQFFGDFNTSKRSITLDLKSEAGLGLAKRLIASSDVFIESFAPGAIERMGLTYEE
ncbi:MAG TPA: CoA transferase, partial [Pseudomonadales bacterium]|nr:CoA transferase [Pseudomonadales bacterium]